MMAWVAAAASVAFAAADAPYQSTLHVRVPMRDGVRLCTHIFRPSKSGRTPSILIRTPYGKGTGLNKFYEGFLKRGYNFVIQDVRGRYDSGGSFEPFGQEGPDGADTLSWIARQPWSDGQVAMVGGSYLGIVQWKLAVHGSPHLKAIFPVVSGYDDYRDRFYSTGGAMKIGNRLLWMRENLRAGDFPKPVFEIFVRHRPLRSADRAATGRTSAMFQSALDHPNYDAWWKRTSTRENLSRVQVPVFAAGGWYDNFVQSDLEAFGVRRAEGKVHHLVVGPWPHNMSYRSPAMDYGPDSSSPIRTMQYEFFEQWLRGGLPAPRPPLRIFVMGINQWRDENEWPLGRAKSTAFYLSARTRANGSAGDGELQTRPPGSAVEPDQFTYDPRNPVPTRGGAVCCDPKVFPWGPLDQRDVEQREDVLVYSSPPLKQDLEVTGPIRAVLWVSSSAPDTDFTAKLVDVAPDGFARNLTDGILRLRFRDSLEQPSPPLAPDHVYRVEIDAGVTSNVFLAGHRIRLEISSSNFPRFDRNPNTGRPIATETELRAAEQTVYHDRRRPSHVMLPVVPRETAPSARLR